MKFITYTYLTIVTTFLPIVALAYGHWGGFGFFPGQQRTGAGAWQTRSAGITSFNSLLEIIQTFLGYMQILIFIAAVFFFLNAAYHFVKGDQATGGKMLMNAALGVLVGLLAFTIIPFLCWLVRASGPACSL